MNAKQPVKIIQIQTRQRKHGGNNNLHQKFLTVAHTDQIVRYAYDEQQGKPRAKEKHLRPVINGIRQCIPKIPDHTKAGNQREGKQNGGKERDTAQTRDRFLVHLTDIRSIKQTLTERDYQNTGDDHARQYHGYKEAG